MKAKITANGNKALYNTNMWIAVTNAAVKDGKDYV
jgi:hypothetical protein